MMDIEVVNIDRPDKAEVIIGQGNFSLKTIDNLYDSIVSSTPGVKFGVAMNEASERIVRITGNDEELVNKAAETVRKIGAGHVFVAFVREAFPMHVLPSIRAIPTVCNIYVATSNPLQVVVGITDLGRSVLGVVDGPVVDKIEEKEDIKKRKEILKKIGLMPEE
ncbi:adenosine monophosphate-protein transferase [Candidatus Micrarchaeota archaeon]|nr:MAG: adenosine monophosphate-protein transferase [Candidatus Micrarchaeota archaeon]